MAVSEEAIFENTYSQYGERLYRLCLVQLKNTHDAEDAVQDVFVKRLYNAPEFKSPEHEKRWIYKVAVNLCRDRLRRKGRFDLPIEAAGDAVSQQRDLTLLESVMRLPEKNRAVIHLHYYEGYSVKEISAILGITISSVKMRLKRGREALQGEWGDTV